MNEMTNHRQERLREILLYERRKYCEILRFWVNVVDSQIKGWNESHRSLTDHQQTWKEIANDVNNLSVSAEDLLRRTGVKERTSLAIQPGDNTGSYYEEEYDSYYSEEGAYEESYEDYSYNESYSAPVVSVPSSGSSTKARALYDYVGTHDYELNFRAGETINILSEDHATGWWIGELRGVQGPFPGNYVEKI